MIQFQVSLAEWCYGLLIRKGCKDKEEKEASIRFVKFNEYGMYSLR